MLNYQVFNVADFLFPFLVNHIICFKEHSSKRLLMRKLGSLDDVNCLLFFIERKDQRAIITVERKKMSEFFGAMKLRFQKV